MLYLASHLHFSTTLRSCRAAAPLPDWCRQTCCRVVVLALKSEWFTTKGMLLVCINHQRNLCPVRILPICSLNMIIRISIVIVWDITSDWHSIWVCVTSVSYHAGRTRNDMRDWPSRSMSRVTDPLGLCHVWLVPRPVSRVTDPLGLCHVWLAF